MDPTTCLQEILEELWNLKIGTPLQNGLSRMEMADRLLGLANWINRGSFPPDIKQLCQPAYVVGT